MAKKRRKIFRRQADRTWKELKPKPKPKFVRIREDQLQPMLREAARAGLVEAIEHCENFWSTSDGYRKYIEQQIALQSDALLAAVRAAIRAELGLRELASRRRKR